MAINDNKRVCIVSGVSAGSRCGVYDYSERLAQALRSCLTETELLNVHDWGLRGTSRIATRFIRHRGVLHVQFPSESMSKRVLPHFIFCGAPFATRVVTFHEFSRLSWRGKLLALPSVLLAHDVIASHKGEAEAIMRTFPFARSKVRCIPIGSNIPTAAKPATRSRDLCFFGMISDNPQVRSFLDVVRRAGLGARTVLMGHAKMSDPKTAAIVQEAKSLGIELAFDLPSEGVAEVLATVNVALLPYVDGISERRGSALAAMANGALVVTTPPRAQEAQAFDGVCLMADKAELLETTLRALAEREHYGDTLRRAKSFAASRSWDRIAADHISLYRARSTDVRYVQRTT